MANITLDPILTVPPSDASAGLDIPGVHALNSRASRFHLALATAVVGIPTLGTIIALVLLFNGLAFGRLEAGLLVGFWYLTVSGLGVGFHRLFSHKAFSTKRWVKICFAIAGSMASQGPLLFWVATHRRHHSFADTKGDAHSPYFKGNRNLHGISGWWHAHTGWLFASETTDVVRYAPDLLKDRDLFGINRTYFVWVLLGLALPFAIGGLVTSSWTGATSGLLWGGLVRIFLVHHCSWSANSICHIYGSRPFKSRDCSTNNWLVALFTLGDGWHNNHHAFPYSAWHGLRWWELDPNAWSISLLQRLGLACNVKAPSPEALAAKARA
jgi:stearoyl-CoA desaturase (delta-9 desaturase)